MTHIKSQTLSAANATAAQQRADAETMALEFAAAPGPPPGGIANPPQMQLSLHPPPNWQPPMHPPPPNPNMQQQPMYPTMPPPSMPPPAYAQAVPVRTITNESVI